MCRRYAVYLAYVFYNLVIFGQYTGKPGSHGTVRSQICRECMVC